MSEQAPNRDIEVLFRNGLWNGRFPGKRLNAAHVRSLFIDDPGLSMDNTHPLSIADMMRIV